MAADRERSLDHRAEVLRAPSGLFRPLDDNSVTGKDGADYGAKEVVAGVIPGDESGDNAEGLVANRDVLIAHERPRGGALFGGESGFAMLQNPLDLFGSDQNFTEGGVDLGFAGVETADSSDSVLVREDEPHKGTKNLPAFIKAGVGPFFLSRGSGTNSGVDILRIGGGDGTQESAGRGSIALDAVIGLGLDGGFVHHLSLPAGAGLFRDGNCVVNSGILLCLIIAVRDVGQDGTDDGDEDLC